MTTEKRNGTLESWPIQHRFETIFSTVNYRVSHIKLSNKKTLRSWRLEHSLKTNFLALAVNFRHLFWFAKVYFLIFYLIWFMIWRPQRQTLGKAWNSNERDETLKVCKASKGNISKHCFEFFSFAKQLETCFIYVFLYSFSFAKKLKTYFFVVLYFSVLRKNLKIFILIFIFF